MKKELFSLWHGFRPQQNTMIKRFTYKELTLILGIIVAVIVIFTLWVRQPSKVFSGTSKGLGFSGLRVVEKSAVKNYFNAFEELLSNRNNPY